MPLIRLLLLILVFSLATACSPAKPKKVKAHSQAPLPIGTLNSAQLHDLFLDRTVDSVTIARGRSTVSY